MSFGLITDKYKSPFRCIPRDSKHVCGFCGTQVSVKYAYNVDSVMQYPEASRADDTSIYACSSCVLKRIIDIPDTRLEYDFDLNDPYEYVKTLQRMHKDADRMHDKFNRKWTYCCGCRTYIQTSEEVTGTDDNRPVLRCSRCGSIHKFLD